MGRSWYALTADPQTSRWFEDDIGNGSSSGGDEDDDETTRWRGEEDNDDDEGPILPRDRLAMMATFRLSTAVKLVGKMCLLTKELCWSEEGAVMAC